MPAVRSPSSIDWSIMRKSSPSKARAIAGGWPNRPGKPLGPSGFRERRHPFKIPHILGVQQRLELSRFRSATVALLYFAFHWK